MDVGTQVDTGGDVKTEEGRQQRAPESETQMATGDAEGPKDPSQRAQEMVTRSKEEASSSETTGAKDAAEQAT